MTRNGCQMKVDVTSDGEGLVSHAGSALLAQVADKTVLTGALSAQLVGLQWRASSHDRGRAVRDQAPLFGLLASGSTAFRVIDQIVSDPDGLQRLRPRSRASEGACLAARWRPEPADN